MVIGSNIVWIGNSIKCNVKSLNNNYNTFYKGFTYNNENFKIDDFALVKTDYFGNQVCQILSVYESTADWHANAPFRGTVKWFIKATDLPSSYTRGIAFDEDCEVVEDLRSKDVFISLENIIKKCTLVYATVSDSIYVISEMKLDKETHFSCRYQVTKDKKFIPIDYSSSIKEFPNAENTPKKKGSAKKMNKGDLIKKKENIPEFTDIPRSEKREKKSKSPGILTPNRAKRNLNVSFNSPQSSFVNYSVVEQIHEEKSIKMKLRISEQQKCEPAVPSEKLNKELFQNDQNQKSKSELDLFKICQNSMPTVVLQKLDFESLKDECSRRQAQNHELSEISDKLEKDLVLAPRKSLRLKNESNSETVSTRKSTRSSIRKNYCERLYEPFEYYELTDSPLKRSRSDSIPSTSGGKVGSSNKKLRNAKKEETFNEPVIVNSPAKPALRRGRSSSIVEIMSELKEEYTVLKTPKKTPTKRGRAVSIATSVIEEEIEKAHSPRKSTRLQNLPTPSTEKLNKVHSDLEENKTRCTPRKLCLQKIDTTQVQSEISYEINMKTPTHRQTRSKASTSGKTLHTPKEKYSRIKPKILLDDSSDEELATPLKLNIRQANLDDRDTPRKAVKFDVDNVKNTPKSKIKLIREGVITPSMQNRETAVAANKSHFNQAKAKLHVSYVPRGLPCREREFDDILDFVARKLLEGSGGCMYISGIPGTGKTATVGDVITTLQERAEEKSIPKFEFISINGMKMSEPRQSYVEIYRQMTGKTIPWLRAQTTLNDIFTKKSTKKSLPIVLLVDELDILCTKRQDVVYNLLDWPTKAVTQLIVITIANTMDLPERLLMGRVTSRLGLTRLTFQPYTHKQLQEIVLQRLMGTNTFNSDAIQFVARKVASVSGDARRALDICRRSAEIAELEGALVSMKHVNEALGSMVSAAKIKAIKQCSRLEQLILQAVVAESARTGVEEMTFADMFTMLTSIAAIEGLSITSTSPVTAAVSRLSASHLLITDQKCDDFSQKIILNANEDDVYFSFRKD